MGSIKFHLSSFLPLAILLVLSSSACSLPSITFREPVWITDVPVTFTGRFNVVEHHTSAGKSVTCTADTTGTLTVDSKGGVTFTTHGGVFTISADGQVPTERGFPCVEQGKDQGWQVKGQVETPGQPFLKFTTCATAEAAGYRAEGSAEHIVAAYQQTTQTGKLTGGVTCYDEHNQPVSEFAFYLAATEPRK